jgi:hypothetical protein
MKVTRRAGSVFAMFALAFVLSGGVQPGAHAASNDPLADEIHRWLSYAADTTTKDRFSQQVKPFSLPALRQIEAELEAGRRWSALHRLAAVRVNLTAAVYVNGIAPDRRTDADFEAEWRRIGADFARDSVRASNFAGVTPAALRAEAEAILPQARIFQEASLDYGRNVETEIGLFYLGAALGQKSLAEFCRDLKEPAAGRAPPLRSIRPEIDELQGKLMAAYVPPASVDRHSEFIGASSVLKEARALDAMGCLHGAMLRYLMAVTRSTPLVAPSAARPRADVVRDLDRYATRFDAASVDHSIARIFIELARGELAASPDSAPALSASIAAQVLPHYLAALEPRAVVAATKPDLDVTLVRWPFT